VTVRKRALRAFITLVQQLNVANRRRWILPRESARQTFLVRIYQQQRLTFEDQQAPLQVSIGFDKIAQANFPRSLDVQSCIAHAEARRRLPYVRVVHIPHTPRFKSANQKIAFAETISKT
jgi:hypothetical protein